MAKRSRGWAVVALILFGALAGRLLWIQVLQHAKFRQKAEETRGRRWPIRAPRGNIYDRNGNPLALNLKLYSVAADPKLISDPAATAKHLAPLLRTPEADLTKHLTYKGDRHIVLRATVDQPVAEAIRRLDLPGLIVSHEWKRAYPHERAGAALLGFAGTDMKGLGGVEAALDRELSGLDGEMLVVLDGRRPESRVQIPGRSVVVKNMVPGRSVALTIDLEIQAIAEEALAEAVKAAEGSGGTAIVMDPESGEIKVKRFRITNWGSTF